MERKKYELIKSDTKSYGGCTLYRVKYLIDIPEYCQKGQLGGYIEKEENLSQVGECVVLDNAIVFGDAEVCDSAIVRDKARVCDRAMIIKRAVIADKCVVLDDSVIEGIIMGNMRIKGDVYIRDGVIINGHCTMVGDCDINPLK